MISYQKSMKTFGRSFELNALPVYDYRYIYTKIRTHDDKVYTNFCGLNVPEDGVECETFTISSIDFYLFVKKESYLQVHLQNCAYKIVDKPMIDLMIIFLSLIKIGFLIFDE